MQEFEAARQESAARWGGSVADPKGGGGVKRESLPLSGLNVQLKAFKTFLKRRANKSTLGQQAAARLCSDFRDDSSTFELAEALRGPLQIDNFADNPLE